MMNNINKKENERIGTIKFSGKILIHRGIYTDYYADVETYQLYSSIHNDKEDIKKTKKFSLASLLPYLAGLLSILIIIATKQLLPYSTIISNVLTIFIIMLITVGLCVYSYSYGAKKIGIVSDEKILEIAILEKDEKEKLINDARKSFVTFCKVIISLVALSIVLSTVFILFFSLVWLVLLLAILTLLIIFISGTKQMFLMKKILNKV